MPTTRLTLIRRRLARARELFPVRLAGVVVAAAGIAVALKVGKEENDHVLFPAGLAAAALVGVCAVCVSLGGLVLWRRVRGAAAGIPETLETTHPARTDFRCPRFSAWPVVDVRLGWLAPAGVAVELGPDGEETVTPRERGRHHEITRVFTVEDIFGLCAISFRITWSQPLRIAPAPAVATAELAASYSHGEAFSHPAGKQEGDLVEMRRYGHGDPLRHILWKTFARTRRLLVRLPERAIAPMPTTVAFFVAGAGDEPTAATARLYLEKGVFGPDFLFSASGAPRPTKHTHEAIDQIIDSAAARADGADSIESLAAQVEASRLATCVVFAPAVDGPWREQVTAFARRLPARATVVIGVDGEADFRERGFLARLLTRAPHADDADSRAYARIPALRAGLEADGLRVQILHRQTGQVL